MSLYDYIDPDDIAYMREWLIGQDFDDITPDQIAELSDADTLYAIEHSYDGGVNGFLNDHS